VVVLVKKMHIAGNYFS